MSLPGRSIMIRFSAVDAAKIDRVCDQFRGVPRSTIARMILVSQLDKPLEEQLQIISDHLRFGGTRRE